MCPHTCTSAGSWKDDQHLSGRDTNGVKFFYIALLPVPAAGAVYGPRGLPLTSPSIAYRYSTVVPTSLHTQVLPLCRERF